MIKKILPLSFILFLLVACTFEPPDVFPTVTATPTVIDATVTPTVGVPTTTPTSKPETPIPPQHNPADDGLVIGAFQPINLRDFPGLSPSKTSGAFDYSSMKVGDVLKVEDGLLMFYEGMTPGGKSSVGVAKSADGNLWQRVQESPVLRWRDATWYSHITAVSVIRDGANYRAWVGANTDFTSTYGHVFGAASSADGLSWEVGDVVLRPAASGLWDDERIDGPSVVKLDNGDYRIYYAATIKTGGWQRAIMCRQSPDGVSDWQYCDRQNPVMLQAFDSPFEGNEVEQPDVVYHNGVWLMAYTGYGGFLGQVFRIGLAASYDGIHWHKLSTVGVINWEPSQDSTTRPEILVQGDTLWLWYSSRGAIYGAVAPIQFPDVSTPAPPTPTPIIPTGTPVSTPEPGSNYIVNGSFEDGFRDVWVVDGQEFEHKPENCVEGSNCEKHKIGIGWYPFYLDVNYTPQQYPLLNACNEGQTVGCNNPDDPDVYPYTARPEYKIADVENRVEQGQYAQQWFCFFKTCSAGVYQNVVLDAGTSYNLCWSMQSINGFPSVLNTDDDWDGVRWYALIAPDHNAFLFSDYPEYEQSQVIVLASLTHDFWTDGSPGSLAFFDTYMRHCVKFVAPVDDLTIGIGADRYWPRANTDNYLDNVTLIPIIES